MSNISVCFPVSFIVHLILFRHAGNNNITSTAAFCCIVYSKLSFTLLIIPVQLHRYIKVHTSKTFISFYYSNTTCFDPTGRQVYKL